MNSRDFEEFLSELNAAEVRYLIIGGYALAVHARPRATQDLADLGALGIAPDDQTQRIIADISDKTV